MGEEDGKKHREKDQTRRPQHFAAHFCRIFRLLNGRRSSQLSIAFLIFLCAIEEFLIYHIGLISAQFYYILLLKDVYKFYIHLAITLALILFMSLIKSAKNYVASVLYIEWRECISEQLITHYFGDLNYYLLSQPGDGSTFGGHDDKWTVKEGKRKGAALKALDNVDQRISQDADRLCAELSNVLSQIVLSPLTILYYSVKVYTTIGLFGLLACITTFLASTGMNRAFIKSIVKWTYLKGKHEGDYRTVLIDSIKNSEMIAFANAETKQKNRTLDCLKRLMSIYENLILSQFFLSLSTSVFDYSGSILSFVIIAIPIFGGTFDHLSKAELSHTISSNTFICLYLINCFSKVLDISSNFGQVNGFGYRITELLDSFKENNRQKFDYSNTLSSESPELLMQFSDVHVIMPSSTDQQLCAIKKLSFEVKAGENVLITGDSGQEKTAILRIIKGFWPISSGSIKCRLNLNDSRQVMIVCYNSKLQNFFQQEITENCLVKGKVIQYCEKYSLNVNLESKCGQASTSLTVGQQQLLNFFIVFCLRPRLVFLEEATNSLDNLMSETLYKECAALSITVVTIASNDSLAKFHTRCIRLNEHFS